MRTLLEMVNNTQALARSTGRLQGDRSEPAGELDSHDTWADEGRARKRLRLSSDHENLKPTSLAQKYCCKMNKLLGGDETSELHGLSRTAP